MRFSYILTPVLALAIAGCATNDPNQRAKTGALIGAVTGAVIGRQASGDKEGAWTGAIAGALAGGAVGNYMDKQQRAMEEALAEEQRRNDLEIQRLQDDSIRINVSNRVSFDFDSAALKPDFEYTLNKVANVLGDYNRTVVHVIGHTDSTGSDRYNQTLSERRAGSVVGYLSNKGINTERLRKEGHGESEPIADNTTESGRRKNRRVEILVKPVVEGQEGRAFQPRE
ncbi:MAG: OmpA family protein [Gammaproteobacteria bacterium]